MTAFARETRGQDLTLIDPYVLNDRVDSEWNYNKDRLTLLRMLGEADKKENARNEKIRAQKR